MQEELVFSKTKPIKFRTTNITILSQFQTNCPLFDFIIGVKYLS